MAGNPQKKTYLILFIGSRLNGIVFTVLLSSTARSAAGRQGLQSPPPALSSPGPHLKWGEAVYSNVAAHACIAQVTNRMGCC